MKVIKTKKYIIFSIAIILLIVCAGICCYKKQEKVKKEAAIAEQQAIEKAEACIKEKAISNAQKYCYTIEFTDEKEFCIKKDDVNYYFRIDTSGTCFDRCKFAVEEENVTVKNGTVILTIKDLGDGNVDVDYDDSRIIVLDDGTEEGMYSGGYFISNTEFDENSLVAPDTLIDGEHKVKKAYDKIMRFTTKEKLKEHYNQALAICNQLNE